MKSSTSAFLTSYDRVSHDATRGSSGLKFLLAGGRLSHRRIRERRLWLSGH